MKKSRIAVLIGGQYGSEGKGVISAHLAPEFDVHIRTGGPNAGHSFHHLGKVWAMQIIPCGWINYDAVLILGAGGLFDMKTLEKEINAILKVDPTITDRVFIDNNSAILMPHHGDEEGGIEGAMHKRIGSTGKGVGTARRDRVMRDTDLSPNMRQWIEAGNNLIFANGAKLSDMLQDTVQILQGARNAGQSIMVEGTQGSGLSLIHGPYPYVTSADTNASQFVADAGIPPHCVTEVILVARTFPIRVAGNSGPLNHEITWGDISEKFGRKVEEKTTVTKLIRRIGKWDEELIERAIMLNAPTHLALTFIDYISPEDEGLHKFEELSPKSHTFIEYVESLTEVPVSFIGTGGNTFSVIDRRNEE